MLWTWVRTVLRLMPRRLARFSPIVPPTSQNQLAIEDDLRAVDLDVVERERRRWSFRSCFCLGDQVVDAIGAVRVARQLECDDRCVVLRQIAARPHRLLCCREQRHRQDQQAGCEADAEGGSGMHGHYYQ